jgi:hypothetical protein
MAMMLVQCPDTGKSISTGVDIDSFSFINLGISPLSIRKCPACGGTHVMTTKDAWLDELPGVKETAGEVHHLREVESQLAG